MKYLTVISLLAVMGGAFIVDYGLGLMVSGGLCLAAIWGRASE